MNSSVLSAFPPAHGAEATMGAMLLDAGKLSVDDAERVLRTQKDLNLRFGEAAVRLGLVSEDDVQQVLARQFAYPYLQKGQNNLSPRLVAAYEPFSPQVEALRAIRSQLMLRWFARGRRALAIVGVTPVAVDDASLTDEERADLAAQLRPTPPLAAAADAVASGVNAMMDVSDGLLLDARRMSDASGVTIAIDSQLLTGGATADLGAMLSGGEDHALLATFPGDVPASFRRIGTVVARAAVPVTVDGSAPSGRDGWDPYRDWDAITG